MMLISSLRAALAAALFSGLIAALAPNAVAREYAVGLARIDVTPDGPIRLCGYAARTNETTEVETRLFARAVAIGSNDEGPAVLVALDATAIPQTITDEVARRLGEKAGVRPDRFVLTVTHTHAAPCIEGAIENMFGRDIPADQRERISKYTKELIDKLEKVALDALADRKPSRLAFGQGETGFAANRRTPGGPVDHALPVLRVTDARTGKLRGAVLNYACHCTTLGHDVNKSCAEWAGYAAEEIEDQHDGAAALIAIGCGADANPHPRGGPEVAKRHGLSLATEAKRLLAADLTEVSGGLNCRLKKFDLPFDTLPTKEQWAELAKRDDPTGYNAKKHLARLERGEPIPETLPYSVQTWTFGDQLAMVFLPGEVVVDYALRLKTEFDAKRLWVTAYANDVPCYIPSRRILEEGGYEAQDAMIYYGRPGRLAPATENLIVRAVHELLPQSYRTEQTRLDYPPPQSPQEAIDRFKLADPDLRVELAAAEPMVLDPVAIDWDAKGRLWVAEMRDFPSGLHDTGAPGGRVSVLEDTNGDGRYDKSVVFLDRVRYPTGIMTWRDGAIVSAGPDVIFARDTNGDGVADVRKVLLSGFSPANEQWLVNSPTWGLDGWVYGASSVENDTIEVVGAGRKVSLGGRDFRFKPDGRAFESAAGRTQHGRTRDDWGNWFGNDSTSLIWHYPLAEEYVRRNPFVAPPPPAVNIVKGDDPYRLFPVSRTITRFNEPAAANRVTGACSPAIYRDDLLGRQYAGNAFVCEPVHNVVRRLVVAPDGVTFSAQRPEAERQREFLSSADNWFRPVQVKTGPDGALWVVDMYRYVVEHPRWVMPDRLKTLDTRAGEDRGRIYRVVSRSAKPRPPVKVSADPIAAMRSRNGALRDIAHREILHRREQLGPQAAETLRAIAGSFYSWPAARVQAMYALDAIDGLAPDQLEVLLRDPEPQVRRHAVRLSEPWLTESALVVEALEDLIADNDATVRYQLALSLGTWDDPKAAVLLGRMTAARSGASIEDPWFRAAVVCSARGRAVDVLETLVGYVSDSAPRAELVRSLAATAAGDGDAAQLQRMLSIILPSAVALPDATDFGRVADVLDVLERGGHGKVAAGSPDISRRLARVIETAREVVRTAGDGAHDAARLLARDPQRRAEDLRVIDSALNSESPPRLQAAAIRELTRSPDPLGPKLLFARWRQLQPPQRWDALDGLLARAEGVDAVTKAMEAGTILPDDIGPAHRARLLQHADDGGARTAAARMLGAGGNAGGAERAAVVERFKPALEIRGDAAVGGQIFLKTCATCHFFKGQGHAVGPDLSALTDRSAPALLTAILHPSAAIDGRYLYYVVETADGRTLTGLVTDETANSLTVLQPNAVRDVVLRKDIKSIRATKQSMMPDGLETGLTPADVAGLIRYIQG